MCPMPLHKVNAFVIKKYDLRRTLPVLLTADSSQKHRPVCRPGLSILLLRNARVCCNLRDKVARQLHILFDASSQYFVDITSANSSISLFSQDATASRRLHTQHIPHSKYASYGQFVSVYSYQGYKIRSKIILMQTFSSIPGDLRSPVTVNLSTHASQSPNILLTVCTFLSLLPSIQT